MAVVCSARVRFEPLRTLAFGGISPAYAGIGTPFANPIRMISITNDTDAPIFISFNGVDDQDYLAAHMAKVYDYSSNKSDQAGFLEHSAGERVYARQSAGAPTTGLVAVTAIYASSV